MNFISSAVPQNLNTEEMHNYFTKKFMNTVFHQNAVLLVLSSFKGTVAISNPVQRQGFTLFLKGFIPFKIGLITLPSVSLYIVFCK